MIDQAITAGFVGIIMALIKLVEYLAQRNKQKPQASTYNGFCPHMHTLEKVVDKIDRVVEKLDTVSEKLAIVSDRIERK